MSNNLFTKNQYHPLIKEQRINHSAQGYPIYSPSIRVSYHYQAYPYPAKMKWYPMTYSMPARFILPVIPSVTAPRMSAPLVSASQPPLPLITSPAAAYSYTPPRPPVLYSDYNLEKILIAILFLVSLDLIFVRPAKRVTQNIKEINLDPSAPGAV